MYKQRASAGLHFVSLLLVGVSGYPLQSALDDGRNFRRGWRRWQVVSLKDGTVLVRLPSQINFLSIGSGPCRRAAYLFSLFILAEILLYTLLLVRYSVGALPSREEAAVRADVLLLLDDGYRLVRR